MQIRLQPGIHLARVSCVKKRGRGVPTQQAGNGVFKRRRQPVTMASKIICNRHAAITTAPQQEEQQQPRVATIYSIGAIMHSARVAAAVCKWMGVYGKCVCVLKQLMLHAANQSCLRCSRSNCSSSCCSQWAIIDWWQVHNACLVIPPCALPPGHSAVHHGGRGSFFKWPPSNPDLVAFLYSFYGASCASPAVAAVDCSCLSMLRF